MRVYKCQFQSAFHQAHVYYQKSGRKSTEKYENIDFLDMEDRFGK